MCEEQQGTESSPLIRTRDKCGEWRVRGGTLVWSGLVVVMEAREEEEQHFD